MRNFNAEIWKGEFHYEDEGKQSSFAKEIIDDSYEALNRFYQKETKRSKTVQRRKLAWQ